MILYIVCKRYYLYFYRMSVKRLTQLFFSPTGTTRKILSGIAQGIAPAEIKGYDLTPPHNRDDFELELEEKNDLVIAGVPVYEEHVPHFLWDALNGIKANGQSIILIAVYGNIGFGMSLVELENWAKGSGFKVVAAAAFIGEHSFSHKDLPLAEGRPDTDDMKVARDFGISIAKKLKENPSVLEEIPGNLPLMARLLPKDSSKFFAHYPEVDLKTCTRCNRCLNVCPSGAIDFGTLKIDRSKCLHCFSCVRVCAPQARQIRLKLEPMVKTVLTRQTSKRKAPEIFI
jgi:ferredoxin